MFERWKAGRRATREGTLLTKERAIEIARQHADAKGWSFAAPIMFEEGWPKTMFGMEALTFNLWTNGNNRGAKATFVIDRLDGTIIRAGYIPR